MGFKFEIAGAQIDGARDYQEDAFLITHLGDKEAGASLVVVADGMGGHAAGNVASNMAVQAFNRHIAANYPSDQLPEVLRAAVVKANDAISETVKETAALKGMGCTLVCAVLEDTSLRWVSVGDSHLYLLRNQELKKKNADHSYGGFLDRMAAEGKEVEPEPGFSRNMLMSALTGDEIADIDCPETPLELQSGDRVIISTDGLDTLSDGKIIYVSGDSPAPKACVDALLQAVEDEEVPRQDNTTVVVIDVQEQAGAARPAPAEAPATSTEEDEEEEATTEPKPDRLEIPLTETDEAPRKSKMPVIAGMAAALVVLAALAYFLLPGEKPVSRPPESETQMLAGTEAETEAPVGAEPAGAAEAEAPAAPEPSETEAAPEAAPEAAAEAAPEAAAEPAQSRAGRSFQDALKIGGSGPMMVWIPAGSFTMGSNRTAEFDERPPHQVRIKKFAMSAYEITFAEYERFAKSTQRRIPDNLYLEKDIHPVIFVSWDDALAYAAWLSNQTGYKYRLPSEAEWEYAARAGSSEQYWWGRNAGSNNAHCFDCDTGLDPRKPTRVGRFKPNPFGVYDTAGNVAEWVYDCYHKNYEGAPADGSVWEGGDCSVRVVRGGSFASTGKSIRPAKRDHYASNSHDADYIGIRVVRDP